MGDANLESLGRILQLNVTLKNICPGKRVAMAVILSEMDEKGTEYPRGVKTMTIPAHSSQTCQDVLVKCVKFVLPEDLDVSGGMVSAICNPRYFKARVLANYDIVKVNTLPDIPKEQQIGFVFPIYAWGAPEPLRDFARALPKTSAFTFGICTCGGNAGNAMKQFSKAYPLQSSYSLIMPNNYIIGSDTDDEAAILEKNQQARQQLEIISQEILSRKAVYRVTEGSMAFLKSKLANWGFEHFARNTKPFHVNENCVGCGLCVKNCPAGTVTMDNGKPV